MTLPWKRAAKAYREAARDWEHTARLLKRNAAAAPEMARLLLELQWVSQETDMGSLPDQCMVCGVTHEWSSSDQRWKNDHRPDCALVAVLRQAGVME